MISPADRERDNMAKVVYITVVCFYFFWHDFCNGGGEGRGKEGMDIVCL